MEEQTRVWMCLVVGIILTTLGIASFVPAFLQQRELGYVLSAFFIVIGLVILSFGWSDDKDGNKKQNN